MKKLIYLEDAIDALKKAYWDANLQSAKDDPCVIDAMADWAIRQIKCLPSAQPESKQGQWRLKIIDRENTLSQMLASSDEALTELHKVTGMPTWDLIRKFKDGWTLQPPSAQPEPIKINIDHELTKDEYEKLLKDMADAPIVLLPSARPDCTDCIKNGGDWDCDHIHCHKGKSAQPDVPDTNVGMWVEDVAYYDEEGCPCIVLRCNQCGEPGYGTNYCANCGTKMEAVQDG